ncbi:MAG: aspartate kinase [Bacteroidota bacterium]|jgi:aspartate kinase
MIVMKFGGTSVQDAFAMRNVLSIAQEYSGQKILMVSSACSGITSELLSIASDSVYLNDEDRIHRIQEIIKRHIDICNELGLEQGTVKQIEDIGSHLLSYCEGIALLGECTDRSQDAIASCGELFSTIILTGLLGSHLNVQWFDARKSMKTYDLHSGAQVNMEQTSLLSNQLLKPLFEQCDIVVTQGFIGSDDDNRTTTLGRGGSDYSAAIFGAVLEAEEIIIWTDVSGIASADPRVIPHARYIECMSFDEARMLSFFGAKVLHPETILPALQKDIPVHVRNTFKASDRGTTITRMGDEAASGMRSVIARKPVSFVQVGASQVSNEHSMSELMKDLEQLSGLKPMISVMIDSTIGLIYDVSVSKIEEYVKHLEEDNNAEIGEYALISAIGPNFRNSNSKEAVKKFHEIIFGNDESPIMFSGIQKNTISALVNSVHAENILKELHALCT